MKVPPTYNRLLLSESTIDWTRRHAIMAPCCSEGRVFIQSIDRIHSYFRIFSPAYEIELRLYSLRIALHYAVSDLAVSA